MTSLYLHLLFLCETTQKKERDCYYHFTGRSEVALVEYLTFTCSLYFSIPFRGLVENAFQLRIKTKIERIEIILYKNTTQPSAKN